MKYSNIKIKIFISFYVICFSFLKAQVNLVPNHSFEILDTCPTSANSPSQYSKDWFDIRITPDYYTSCPSMNLSYKPPATTSGYQCPANGNSFIGIYTFFPPTFNPGANELFAIKLSDSLVKNTKYYVSLKVVHCGANGVNYATSKMGAKFFTKKPDCLCSFPTATDKYVNNFAHLYSNQIIADTLNWTTIKGSFVADSNYKYIGVGCFFSYQFNDTTKVFSWSGSGKAAYYFIDDVCVSTDSNTCKIPNQSSCMATSIKEIIAERSIYVAPNPCTNFFYVMGISEIIEFKLFNTKGSLIKSGIIHEFENVYINDLPEAVYVLQLFTDKGVVSKKIIIKN